MPRGYSVFSRALTGLASGALLVTTLQFASVGATAAELPDDSDFDPVAALEAARETAPEPPPPATVPQDRAVRLELREVAESIETDGLNATAHRSGPHFAAPESIEGAASEIVAAGATVRGTVTDSAGSPVAAVTVTLYGYAEGNSDPVAYREVTTPADGNWTIEGIDPVADYWHVRFADSLGRFATQYWDGLSEYYVPTPIELTEGAVVDAIDATMYRQGTISGIVSGGWAGYSDPYVAADLLVYDSVVEDWVLVDWTSIGFEGSYAFFNLSPDFYVVRATYASERGVGYAFSPITWLEESGHPKLDLSVDRDVIGPDRDFSGDWATDVLAVASNGTLRMYQGDGWGDWVGSSQIGSGWAGMNTVFYAGDFSGDGHTDVIARDGSGNLFLYRGNGKGGWAGSAKIGTGWGGFTSVFAPGDFDGDGNVDVMARDKAGALHLYRGNGAGGWLNRVTVGSGWQGFNTLIGAGDFDGDWNPDVITRDGSGRLWLFSGNGTGGWLAKRQIGSGWQNFTAVVGAGDFWGGDWAPDLLVRDVYGRLIVYAGDGTGGWIGAGQVGQGWNGLRIVG